MVYDYTTSGQKNLEQYFLKTTFFNSLKFCDVDASPEQWNVTSLVICIE